MEEKLDGQKLKLSSIKTMPKKNITTTIIIMEEIRILEKKEWTPKFMDSPVLTPMSYLNHGEGDNHLMIIMEVLTNGQMPQLRRQH